MLNELRHFLLIVKHGTFTEAARRAHLSQPALTAAIRRLEHDMGAALLHRSRTGAELTAAGQALVPRARAALAAVEDGRRAVAEVLGLERGEVRIGAGATACTYLLPKALAAFRRKHPKVRFRLREAFTSEMQNALADGEIDIAVVTGEGSDHWRSDEMIIVASPKLDARDAGFITFTEGSTTRALLERHFPNAEIVMELGSIAAVKGNVRAGIGKALVSRAAVDADLTAGRLVEVPSRPTPITRQLSLLHRGLDRLTPAAAALREVLLSDKFTTAAPRRSRAKSRRTSRR